MIDSPTVASLVRTFQGEPEDDKSRDLILDLLRYSPTPFSRSEFNPGHITCTGLVLARDGERILLVHHRRLDRWLLPGGHVEPEDPEIWESARREVIEETGAMLVSDGTPPLVGVDVHGIPPRRVQPYHLHHDLLFAFRATAEEFRLSEESRAITWCRPSEFNHYDLPANIRRAYRRFVA